MKSISEVQVKTRGRITLPKDWRRANNIADGDLITLIHLGDGVVVMRASKSEVNRQANQLRKEWRQAGVTLEDMLQEQRKIRK